jgi:hypothetical protein
VPVAIVMAGGYADNIDDVVDIHFNTITLALERHGPKGGIVNARKPRVRARVD